MTTNKLLTGVALAALLAGAAQAQDVALGAGSDFQNQDVADEIAVTTLDGDLVIDFELDGAFAGMGAGGAVEVTVTLTNAEFSSTVSPSAWTAASDADCGFGTPTVGGGAGGTTIVFENTGQLNLCSGAGADDGFLTLPIEVTTNGTPVSVNVDFNGTTDVGSFTDSDIDLDVLDFAQALTFAVNAGDANSGQFDTTGETLTGSGVIGSISLADFPADIEFEIGQPLAAVTDIAASGEVTITLTDETGIGSVSLGGVACDDTAAPVYTCAMTGADLDALASTPADIEIAADAVASAVTAQAPTAELSVDPIALSGNVIVGVAATPTSPITLQGADATDTVGVGIGGVPVAFEWFRIGSGGTESNVRIALANDKAASDVREVILTIGAGNNDYPATVTLLPGDAATGFRTSGNLVSFTSEAVLAALQDADPTQEAGNADITGADIVYDSNGIVTADIEGAVARRLMITRSGNAVAGSGFDN